MIELIAAGIFYLTLSLLLIYRLGKGPSVVDRIVAANSIYLLITIALITFAVYSKRGIYLDIALLIALIGFVGTIVISKYLEEKL